MFRRPTLAVVLVLSSCARPEGAVEQAPPKRVHCANAVERQATDVIEVRGSVAPPVNRDAQVAPQVAGRLVSVEVREGDTVTAGQVLAKVDDAPLLDVAREAQAAVERVQADRLNAETTLDRTTRVFDRGIAPKQDVDDAVARRAAARAGETEAQATARQAERQVSRAVVKSPFAGVVLRVIRHAGELVDGTPTTPVVEIADISALDLVSDVPASDLVRISRAAEATLAFPSMPGSEFHGTVSLVSPGVDPTTGVGTVRVTLAPSKTPPPVGLYGVGKIVSGTARSVVVVPVVSLRNALGNVAEVVVCGKDGAARVQSVKTNGVGASDAEIVSGLTAADAVAVDPVLGLADGDRLQVVP
jgi:RND family efflux transporter MFP subunit